MCCIELMGEEQRLLVGLAHLTSPETGKLYSSTLCMLGNFSFFFRLLTLF